MRRWYFYEQSLDLTSAHSPQIRPHRQPIRISRKLHHARANGIATGRRLGQGEAFEQATDHTHRNPVTSAHGIDHALHAQAGRDAGCAAALRVVRAASKAFLASLLRLVVLLVLPATLRLAKTTPLSFSLRSQPLQNRA